MNKLTEVLKYDCNCEDTRFVTSVIMDALLSDVLKSEEFNSIIEQAPTLANKIAEVMRMKIGELRLAVLDRKVTGTQFYHALKLAIDQAYDQIKQERLNQDTNNKILVDYTPPRGLYKEIE